VPRIKHPAEACELTAHPGSGYRGNQSSAAPIANSEQIFVQVEFFEHSLALRKKCATAKNLRFATMQGSPGQKFEHLMTWRDEHRLA